jgi:hypothetical protein
MSLCKRFPWVRHFIRILKGGSQPIVAEASDGLLYVVKFADNPQGPNVLINEAMGAALYQAFRLPVPDWTPLRVASSFFDQIPNYRNKASNGRWHAASGLCLGSRFLGGEGIRLREILPKCDFKKVANLEDFWLAWLIDICADHADPRQAIFTEENGQLTAFFIDHGHMFGGPRGDLQCPAFEKSRYWDFRIYPLPAVKSIREVSIMKIHYAVGSLRAESLWKEMKSLPDEWISSQALEEYAKCINLLATPDFIEMLHEKIVDSIERKRAGEDLDHQSEERLLALRRSPRRTIDRLASGIVA